jgi:hypothetical protein
MTTIEATRQGFAEMEPGKDVFARAKVTADRGFHSNAVVAAVEETGADACVADRDYRRREPAFAGASRFKRRDKKERGLRRRRKREARESAEPKQFTVRDFLYDEANARCICPAGQKLKHPEGPPPRRRSKCNEATQRMRWVSAQWKLFTMVHNIEKVAGWGARQ